MCCFLYFCIAFGSHFCDRVLFFGMRSNLCWLSCVVFVISVLPLDLIFMIACYLFWVEMSLCRFSCVVCYISVLPLDLIFVKALYLLEWDRIYVGFLVLLYFSFCIAVGENIQLVSWISLNPPHFVLIPMHDMDFQRPKSWSFCWVEWLEIRGGCSFCWYWGRLLAVTVCTFCLYVYYIFTDKNIGNYIII